MPHRQFGSVHPSWLPVLAPFATELEALGKFLEAEEATGQQVLPAPPHILRALSLPADEVRVIILGQDPYPTPGHAMGLAFSVDKKIRPIPRSLTNIYRELTDDLGITPPDHGDLSTWQDQGVLLLNRCLSVRAGAAGSHRGRGWEMVTAALLEFLAARGGPLVAILWGKDAQLSGAHLPGVATIASAHPSPLSARRGFFGSRPFSQCNALLSEQGSEPVDWEISR